jgi:hypothetical protein
VEGDEGGEAVCCSRGGRECGEVGVVGGDIRVDLGVLVEVEDWDVDMMLDGSTKRPSP